MTEPPVALLPSDAMILVVDDDARLRERLAAAFEQRGYHAVVAADAEEALRVAAIHLPSAAVVDLRMPGASGLELLVSLRQQHHDIRVVLLTGYGSIATAVDAVKLGAVDVVQKPADADLVLAALARGPAVHTETDEAEYRPPSLARAEWEHINRVLEDCGGNISRAARKLGLHRRTLQRKLQKYPPRE